MNKKELTIIGSIFALHVILFFYCLAQTKFIKGDCFESNLSEAWEQRTVWKVLKVGNQKYLFETCFTMPGEGGVCEMRSEFINKIDSENHQVKCLDSI